MDKDEVVKRVCEIMDVKYSHYDDHMGSSDYFPNMKLESPVRLVCYPGMAPWSFAILENMDVITPTSQFAFTILGVYESLKNVEGSTDLVKKYETMVADVEDELKRLKEAKEFLINSGFTWYTDIPNPDGGVSSTTLAMELGATPEQAIKFDHDINKIVKNG